MKILIIGFYGYEDGYKALGEELEKYYKIYFFKYIIKYNR